MALSYSSRGTVLAGAHKAGARESERYSASAVRKQRERMWCAAPILFISNLAPQPMECVSYTYGGSSHFD